MPLNTPVMTPGSLASGPATVCMQSAVSDVMWHSASIVLRLISRHVAQLSSTWGGMETVSWGHSQSIAIGDVESNGRPAIDESDTRSESALHTSALGPRKHNGHSSLLTSLPSVPGAQLT